MIFSDKIIKIINGENATLFLETNNQFNLYIFNKTLKKYKILKDLNINCVFYKNFNYKKIIELNNKKYAICCNDFITITDEGNI